MPSRSPPLTRAAVIITLVIASWALVIDLARIIAGMFGIAVFLGSIATLCAIGDWL